MFLYDASIVSSLFLSASFANMHISCIRTYELESTEYLLPAHLNGIHWKEWRRGNTSGGNTSGGVAAV